MRRSCLFWSVSFVLALASTLFAAPVDAARRRPAGGSITGRVSPATAGRAERLAFTVDGARARPQMKRGKFLLRGVPAGAHMLSVVDTGANAGAHVQVAVRRGQTVNVGTLALTPGGQITGLVTKLVGPDGGDVEPLAGVEVHAQREGRKLPPGNEDGGGHVHSPLPDPAPLVAVTDESGAYAFRGVAPGGYLVSVVIPGLEAEAQFVYVEVGRTSVADFQLRESIEPGVGTVAGRVTDLDGAPVEGALVTIYSGEIYYPRDNRGDGDDGTVIWPPSRGFFSTLTDQHGQFSLNVPSGHLALEVYADGYQPAYLQLTLHPRERLEVSIRLEPYEPPATGAIAGRVTDAVSGEPVREARVTLLIYVVMDGNGTAIYPGPPVDRWTTLTGRDGRYELPEVPAGQWQVMVERDGYATQVLDVEVHGHHVTTLDVKLEAGEGD